MGNDFMASPLGSIRSFLHLDEPEFLETRIKCIAVDIGVNLENKEYSGENEIIDLLLATADYKAIIYLAKIDKNLYLTKTWLF